MDRAAGRIWDTVNCGLGDGPQASRPFGEDFREQRQLALCGFHPVAKYCRTNTDMGGPKSDGCLEIGAHAHGQLIQAITVSEFRQQGKMQAGLLVYRRDAHQAPHRQV